MSFVLGVDVGTTSAAAATKRGDLVQACRLGTRSQTMPSVVAFQEDGSARTGQQAARRAGLELADVERDLRHDRGPHAYPIVVEGQVCTPYTMLRALHAGVLDRACTLHDALPSQVVVTHPVVPESHGHAVLEQIAGELFAGALLVPEPVAATAKFACDWMLPADGVVATYDLGGGTCDVALVRRQEDMFSVLAADYQGLTDVGGIDVDNLVLGHVDTALGGAIARLNPSDRVDFITLSRLRTECRAAKERLSYQADVTIDASLPDEPAVVTMRRHELEDLLLPLLEPGVDMLMRLIGDNELRVSDIHAVAVVGGSARIPLVAKLIGSRTGLPVIMDDAPELTVALGAAQMIDSDIPADSAFPLADVALPSLATLIDDHAPPTAMDETTEAVSHTRRQPDDAPSGQTASDEESGYSHMTEPRGASSKPRSTPWPNPALLARIGVTLIFGVVAALLLVISGLRGPNDGTGESDDTLPVDSAERRVRGGMPIPGIAPETANVDEDDALFGNRWGDVFRLPQLGQSSFVQSSTGVPTTTNASPTPAPTTTDTAAPTTSRPPATTTTTTTTTTSTTTTQPPPPPSTSDPPPPTEPDNDSPTA